MIDPTQSPPAPPLGSPSNTAGAMTGIAGLSLRLLWQWWPQAAALTLACGIVAATISGAMGVADSLQRGLHGLALARLGQIDAAVLTEDFFRRQLARELADTNEAGDSFATGSPAHIVPAIVLSVSLETVRSAGAGEPTGSAAEYLSEVGATLLACEDPALLGFTPTPDILLPDTAAINETLAQTLNARVGDTLIIRIATRSDVPADSPLGIRSADSTGRRLRVNQILPRQGIGQFSLRPTQVTGGLALTTLATAQEILRRGDVANTIIGTAFLGNESSQTSAWLEQHLAPGLEDYGLSLRSPSESEGLRLSSRRLILSPEIDRAAQQILAPLGGTPSLVFLANCMSMIDQAGSSAERIKTPASIPYSTVIGIESTSLPVGDLVDDANQRLQLPGPEEIVINRWMAHDFAQQGRPVAIGDTIEVHFFLPETLHGRVEETSCRLRVSGIAAMRGAAVARSLVPDVAGITDEKSIADWDPPFPFDAARVRTTPPQDQDDRYWKEYGTTPKAFVSLTLARRLAGSRFGKTTAWHLRPNVSVASLDADSQKLPVAIHDAESTLGQSLAAAIKPAAAGITTLPLRTLALTAAKGSTPFGGLFLGLSSFVVAAGLILEWLLFTLLVASRRRDIGILSAIGWSPGRIARLLVFVGGSAAVTGILIGTLVGPLWSWLLLAWLAKAWTQSVATGSQQVFGADWPSLAAIWPGALVSGLLSLLAIWWASQRAARMLPLTLLKGTADDLRCHSARIGRACGAIAGLSLLSLMTVLWIASRVDAALAPGLFFLSGALALSGLLAVARCALPGRRIGQRQPLRTLGALAWRGLAHSPSRTFSVVAIVAMAEFLIVAVSSFALSSAHVPNDPRGPTGGWTFLASFGKATSIDPTDPQTQSSLGLTESQSESLARCTVALIRSNDGDDASCTNLFAPAKPTVLGLGPAFIARGGFRFVDHATHSPAMPLDRQNPWLLLEAMPPPEFKPPLPRAVQPIPAILDQATAQWGLKLGGVGSVFALPDETGATIEFVIVGLLEPGILQGAILISEKNFVRIFPARSGYALALVDGSGRENHSQGAAGRQSSLLEKASVTTGLRAAWADSVVTLEPTATRLDRLYAVQNIFLAGFQALGTLGLLLGTAGVAAVSMQGVLERVGAFALLRAVGFTLVRIRQIILLETAIMVGIGLMIGTLSGCLAVTPSLVQGRASVPLGWIVATSGLSLLTAIAAGLFAASQATIPTRPQHS